MSDACMSDWAPTRLPRSTLRTFRTSVSGGNEERVRRETRAAENLPRMKDRDGGRTKGIVIQGQLLKTENGFACFERELVSLI